MLPERPPRKIINEGTTPTDAAKIIGIGRATLYRALQREAY
jgi:DNA invertase Pin-like site-specific DNA recombinase